MSDALLVSTRKGLFTIARKAHAWEIAAVDFLGDNVTLSLVDRRDGRRYAALDHGHFGVKLHRSTANGWEEIPTPVYPPKPEGYEEYDFWPSAQLEHGAHLGARGRRRRRARRHLVRNPAGRPVSLP